MITAADLIVWKELEQAATPGPWETGIKFMTAGVNDGSNPYWFNSDIPEGKCHLCANFKYLGTITVHGANKHVHANLPNQESVVSLSALGTIVPDCEITEANAAFIATAREAMPRLMTEVEHLTQQKDGAYSERNQLVGFISKLFPASLERHEPSDDSWDDDWRWVVYIDLPTGQVSWHIHDSELPNFSHLPQHQGRRWDGHTVAEKYARLNNHIPRKTVSKMAAMTPEDIAEMNDLPR